MSNKIDKIIIVEGKYDRIKLNSIVKATIIETGGFEIFTNKQKQKMIRTLAQKKGIIIFTDSDVAGFRIRRFICSIVPKEYINHAYIPDIIGKERRKVKPSKEGKLGVEGVDKEIIIKALENAGAMNEQICENKKNITKMDFYNDGFIGMENSSDKRAKLIKKFDLPEYMTTNGLIEVLNSISDYDEYKSVVKSI